MVTARSLRPSDAASGSYVQLPRTSIVAAVSVTAVTLGAAAYLFWRSGRPAPGPGPGAPSGDLAPCIDQDYGAEEALGMDQRDDDSRGGNGDAGGQSNTPGAVSGGLWPRLLGSLWAPRRPGPGTAEAEAGAGSNTAGRAGGAARGGVWVGAPAAVAPDDVRPVRRVDQGPVRQGAGEAARAGVGRDVDGEAERQQQQQQAEAGRQGDGDADADGGEAAEDGDGSEEATEGGCTQWDRGQPHSSKKRARFNFAGQGLGRGAGRPCGLVRPWSWCGRAGGRGQTCGFPLLGCCCRQTHPYGCAAAGPFCSVLPWARRLPRHLCHRTWAY